MKHSVCVVTGTRAEFGLLQPLLNRLNNDKKIELRLVVTGSHLSKEFGDTQNEIEQAGFLPHARIPVLTEEDSKVGMAKATAKALSAFTDYFADNRPRLLIILGDRYEIFAAAVAAAILGIPIAHIHGGETTEGAIDEFLRHSITKMSYLHFTACEEYRRRVIQLGEAPERVFNVGALGIENILHLPLLTLSELQENIGFGLDDAPYCMVTFHPVTLEENTIEEQICELIRAMDLFPEMKFIITKANADAGGRTINRIWDEEAKKHTNWHVVPSLGVRRYLTALKYAKMIIGNSSSGITEAPAMHIPTVNIGDRQKGRMLTDSIICCSPQKDSIAAAMEKALSPAFKVIVENTKCPYGDGNTSEKIYKEVCQFIS